MQHDEADQALVHDSKVGLHVQDKAVEYVASTMQRLYEEQGDRKRLFLIQTYNIGKERVFLEVPTLELCQRLHEIKLVTADRLISCSAHVSELLYRTGGAALQVQALLHREEAGHDELPGHAR